jgi:hypothetical protein
VTCAIDTCNYVQLIYFLKLSRILMCSIVSSVVLVLHREKPLEQSFAWITFFFFKQQILLTLTPQDTRKGRNRDTKRATMTRYIPSLKQNNTNTAQTKQNCDSNKLWPCNPMKATKVHNHS